MAAHGDATSKPPRAPGLQDEAPYPPEQVGTCVE
jgi:hypothetical protein